MAETAADGAGKGKKGMKWYYVALIVFVLTMIVAYFYWGMNVITSKSQVLYDTSTGKALPAGSSVYNPSTGALMTT